MKQADCARERLIRLLGALLKAVCEPCVEEEVRVVYDDAFVAGSAQAFVVGSYGRIRPPRP
jgi:hypothetical protein